MTAFHSRRATLMRTGLESTGGRSGGDGGKSGWEWAGRDVGEEELEAFMALKENLKAQEKYFFTAFAIRK